LTGRICPEGEVGDRPWDNFSRAKALSYPTDIAKSGKLNLNFRVIGYAQ
jgi:hypothetical protein